MTSKMAKQACKIQGFQMIQFYSHFLVLPPIVSDGDLSLSGGSRPWRGVPSLILYATFSLDTQQPLLYGHICPLVTPASPLLFLANRQAAPLYFWVTWALFSSFTVCHHPGRHNISVDDPSEYFSLFFHQLSQSPITMFILVGNLSFFPA